MTMIAKKLTAIFLMVALILTFIPSLGNQTAYAAEEPAAIQNTYELDGVTYFDVGSKNFTSDQIKFFKDLLGYRTSVIKLQGEWDDQEYDYKYYDQSEADLWLQTGVMLLTDLTPSEISNKYNCFQGLFNAAVRGSFSYDQNNGMTYTSTRYDVDGKNSPREAEKMVFQKTFGENKNFGYYKDDTTEQLTLASAVNVKEQYNGQTTNIYTVAAYFNNFRISALIPSDEGSNYVTELINDTVNSRSTTASTVKNLTATTVTGSQSVSNSISASVSNSLNGSETYSKSVSKKVGASYKFSEAFSVSGEVSWSESEAFSTGWGTSDSVTKNKSASYSVSVPMAPYTQVMITQSDTTSVYLTRYNCPITLSYDVTIVCYQTGQLGDGILHTKDTQIYVDGEWIDIDRDQVYTFSDPLNGARGDLDARVKSCESWNDMDDQGLRWRYILENAPEQYDLRKAPDSVAAARKHVPMSSTGGAYTQTLNVVASEVTGLMPTHPLYRVKIAEPGVNIHTDEVSYQLYDYFTAKMKVGDFSYANYMNLIGLNRYDVPFYGFSKDNGYWIVTDKEGNELDPADSPVRLEVDPVSTNWRYTAVKPGTCFLVYRIDEDAYYIAERPDDPIKNDELKKTAALEIIVTERNADDICEPTEHEMVRTKRQAPTCTELGNIEYYTCTECEGIFRDKNGTEELSPGDLILPALGHDWTEWETEKEPTETEEGLQTRFCKNDTSHVQTRSVPVLPHKHIMVKTQKKAPTCTKDGNILHYTCSVCGWVFTDYAGNQEIAPEDAILKATGHKWDSGKVTKEPTTTAEGEKTFTCKSCGEKKVEILDKIVKKTNPLKVEGKTATVKYSNLKDANQTLAASKVITFTKNGKGTITYTKSSGDSKITINKSTGKVTVKKGLKKGTYSVKVKVKAAGNSKYKSATKTVTFKITVK